MQNWGVVGHNWAVEQLGTAIAHHRVGHAYLITGPAQVGRATLARAFAQALNCQNEYLNNRPCGVCRSCQLIAGGKHPDLRVVVPEISARGRASIKIDQMRELQRDLNFAPVEGRYKIAIVEQFDAANQSAANAFLKTLEEPPSNVILILTAAESDSILPTINSRCRTVNLRSIPTDEITAALIERWGIAPAEAKRLAHLSNGRLGWAVDASETPLLLEGFEEQRTLLLDILQQNRVGRFAIADKMARKAETLPEVLQVWLSWWRDVMILAFGEQDATGETQLINVDLSQTLVDFASIWPSDKVLECLNQTSNALWQLERNANARLVIENLLLTYPFQAEAG